jgi:hypothetical protein
LNSPLAANVARNLTAEVSVLAMTSVRKNKQFLGSFKYVVSDVNKYCGMYFVGFYLSMPFIIEIEMLC